MHPDARLVLARRGCVDHVRPGGTTEAHRAGVRLRGSLRIDRARLDIAGVQIRTACVAGVRVVVDEPVDGPPLSARRARNDGRPRRSRGRVVDVDPAAVGADVAGRVGRTRVQRVDTVAEAAGVEGRVEAARRRARDRVRVVASAVADLLGAVDRQRDPLHADLVTAVEAGALGPADPAVRSPKRSTHSRDSRQLPVAQRNPCAVERSSGPCVVLRLVSAAGRRASAAVRASDAHREGGPAVEADRHVRAGVRPSMHVRACNAAPQIGAGVVVQPRSPGVERVAAEAVERAGQFEARDHGLWVGPGEGPVRVRVDRHARAIGSRPRDQPAADRCAGVRVGRHIPVVRGSGPAVVRASRRCVACADDVRARLRRRREDREQRAHGNQCQRRGRWPRAAGPSCQVSEVEHPCLPFVRIHWVE